MKTERPIGVTLLEIWFFLAGICAVVAGLVYVIAISLNLGQVVNMLSVLHLPINISLALDNSVLALRNTLLYPMAIYYFPSLHDAWMFLLILIEVVLIVGGIGILGECSWFPPETTMGYSSRHPFRYCCVSRMDCSRGYNISR